MKKKLFFYPYNKYSQSVWRLVEGLDALIIKRERSRYVPKENHIVVNWGCTERPRVLHDVPVVNPFDCVDVATSKTATYRRLDEKGIKTVVWTNSLDTARDWSANGRVIGRTRDRGARGVGVTVYQKGQEVGDALFWCKYVKKERELRVHVFNGEVIFEQEKVRKHVDRRVNYDRFIRSHNRGWCFAFHHLVREPIPVVVRESAVAAVRALGLYFGAVDVGWSERSGATVFEVNTAPGLEESSLEAYVESFRRMT